RGWFGDIEHRREALDRLLPTIRAAADPITRDLYLSLVAERTGVSRDVLAKEAAALPQPMLQPAEPPGRRAAEPTSRHAAPQRPRRRANAAETGLMLVLLGAPEWRERAAAEVDPAWLVARARPHLRRSVHDAGGAAAAAALRGAAGGIAERIR